MVICRCHNRRPSRWQGNRGREGYEISKLENGVLDNLARKQLLGSIYMQAYEATDNKIEPRIEVTVSIHNQLKERIGSHTTNFRSTKCDTS